MYDKPPSDADQAVTRAVLCSGKVYYDLAQRRTELGLEDSVALLRLEQLAPFPRKVLAEELARYPESTEVVWCQEEPQNMGAWTFVEPRLGAVLDGLKRGRSSVRYAGRAAAASTATGLMSKHLAQRDHLLDEALGG
jgi:2-oxoglutarate dehydrogenase E1 component